LKFKTDIEFADIDCPIKPPRIVREFGNVFVLISVLVLPTSCISVALTTQHVPWSYRETVGTLMGVAFCLAWICLPFYVAKVKASRWLLSVIQYFLQANDLSEASRIASKYAQAISFGDFSRAAWFQAFLIEHRITDPWGAYAGYFRQLAPSGPGRSSN